METKKEKELKVERKSFVELMVEKIDNKELLTKDELEKLVFEEEFNTTRNEPRGWSCTATSIFKHKDRMFAIVWENGLTENQPNEFMEQPYEVKEEVETFMVKRYPAIK